MHIHLSAAAAAFASATVAQVVWTVPNGQDVDPYIAQASAGDILLLGGSHPPFHLDKGLTILGLGTDPITGTTIGGLSNYITVDVPAGQRATLAGFSLFVYSQTGSYTTGILVYSGQVAIADVNSNAVFSLTGEVIVQRVNISAGGLAVSGLCSISDSTVTGRNFATTFTSVLQPGPGISVSGAGARLVASRVTATGGVGGSSTSPPVQYASSPGVTVTGGQVFLTDCTLIGGAGTASIAGGVALAGNGTVSIARTTLTDGLGAVGTSSGYQQVAAMVGMHSPAPPTRGASWQALATAGNSQSLLGIVGGFDRTANTLPPIVEPLFGIPAQLAALTLAFPAPGGQVPVAIAVPNVPALFGVDVWLQAVQLAGITIRASTVVGGAIR